MIYGTGGRLGGFLGGYTAHFIMPGACIVVKSDAGEEEKPVVRLRSDEALGRWTSSPKPTGTAPWDLRTLADMLASSLTLA